jgi:hypothetical protein
MYLHKIQKQILQLKKGKEVQVDLKGKPTSTLQDLYFKIEHPSEDSLTIMFVFENVNGSVFRYPKRFIRSGQPLTFDDNNYRFEGPIKSIKLISEEDIEITVN